MRNRWWQELPEERHRRDGALAYIQAVTELEC